MRPIYINYRYRATEDVASTEEEAAKILDEMREYSREWCGTLAHVGLVDDPEQGPGLLIGVDDAAGFTTYGGDGNGPVISYGGDVGGTVTYSFKLTPADFPASVEIPFDTVKQAVIEFLVSDGGRPSCVSAWQPDRLP